MWHTTNGIHAHDSGKIPVTGALVVMTPAEGFPPCSSGAGCCKLHLALSCMHTVHPMQLRWHCELPAQQTQQMCSSVLLSESMSLLN